MKLCIASQYLSAGSGGIARVARLMLQVGLDNGHDVYGLAAADKLTGSDLPENVRAFGGNRLAFVMACQRMMMNGTPIIYDFSGTARAHFGPLGSKIPYALWMHGIEVWEQLRPRRKSAIVKAHTLFVNSEYTKARAISLHGGALFDRAKVCWLGTLENEAGVVSPQRYRTVPTVLIVGRLEDDRDKGHTALIKSWPAVVAAVPDARLIIIGSALPNSKVIAEAKNSPVLANIDLIGHASEQKLAEYFSTANIFAMPSYGEGFGLVYIEAMRYALPVIASTIDAGQEVNIDGITGYNVTMDKPDMLTERLIELLANPDRAQAMGQAGLQRWETEFKYERFRQRFSPLLQEFLATYENASKV